MPSVVSAANTAKSGPATSFAFNMPAGGAVGDVYVCYYRTDDTSRDLAAPTGWVKPTGGSTAGSSEVFGFMYRVRDGTEGATETISTTAGSCSAGGRIVLYTGVDAADVLNGDNFAIALLGSSVNPFAVAADAITGVAAGSEIICAWGAEADRTISSIATAHSLIGTSLVGGTFCQHIIWEDAPGSASIAVSVSMNDTRQYGYILHELKAAASGVDVSLGEVTAGATPQALTVESRALLPDISATATVQGPTVAKLYELDAIATTASVQVLTKEPRALLPTIATSADVGAGSLGILHILATPQGAASVQALTVEKVYALTPIEAGAIAFDVTPLTDDVTVSLGVVAAAATVPSPTKETRALLAMIATAATMQGLTPEARRLLEVITAGSSVQTLTPEIRALLEAIDAGASVQTIAGSVALVLYPIAHATGPALYEPMIGKAER